MKLPAETSFLNDASAQQVFQILHDAGHAVYFVGGCVRNAVMGAPASDIDISTDARPEEVMAVTEAAGLKAVPTGIDHGTVTVIAGDQPFEITTFRRDVETDGRRAVVSFSSRIEEDALRRDFTMNALYARLDGRVVDPLGGLPDALAGRVVFIEDASARIAEDYLRILRFFRFWACYADQAAGFDPETLAAIAEHLDGLARLSAERVGTEMLKVLAAQNPGQAIATMEQIGVLPAVMPIASTEVLPRLIHLEGMTGTKPDAIRRLAALGPCDARDRLRLSKQQSKDLETLREMMGSALGPKALGFSLGATLGWDAALLRAAALEQDIDPNTHESVISGAAATFPVAARDLALDGPALGAKLKELRNIWLTSELALSKEQLLG